MPWHRLPIFAGRSDIVYTLLAMRKVYISILGYGKSDNQAFHIDPCGAYNPSIHTAHRYYNIAYTLHLNFL